MTLAPSERKPRIDVLSQAAHDLQEPLRLLAGYLDLLVAHHEGRLALDAPRLTREARDTTRRMQDLVASLLDLSRREVVDPQAAPLVPLGAALGDALGNLHLRLRETGAEVVNGPLPAIHGDRAQLARIFQNLVENSLKYALPERPPVVRIMARDQGEHWLVTVDDNGPGWPREGREHLFEPFARLRSDAPGAGLGLAMVRAIVERHEGHVAATDAPHGGARVEIRFPREVT